MNKKKLWVVSEVFYPDIEIATGNIATEIALKLAEKFDVHVICGPKDYDGKKNEYANQDIETKLTIHRINRFNFNKNKKSSRILRVLSISIAMFFKGFKIKPDDNALIISNPAFITPLFGLLKYIKGITYSLLMHDVFPENLLPGGYMKPDHLFYKITQSIFAKSRRKASKIAVLGRDMQELIRRDLPETRRNDVVIIPNWADIDDIFPAEDVSEVSLYSGKPFEHKIIIQFAGNHGPLQNLLSFLEIISKVKNENLHFVFAGSGATKKEMIDFKNAKKLENVSFLDQFPRSELNKYQNSCTIGLVSLKDELYGVGVPSKSYNILSAGKPILFLGNLKTEIPQFILEHNSGWAFEYKNELKLLDFFESLTIDDLEEIHQKGKNGRKAVELNFNKSKILQSFEDLFEN